MTFREWFTNFLFEYNWSKLYQIEKSDYFRTITTDISYWETHLHMFENAGIDDLSTDAKIIDIGVWFGIMPFALQQYGFTNVSTTERFSESAFKRKEFEKLWQQFEISPINFEIFPGWKFKLWGNYDLILMTESNVFWKTDEVIRYDGTTISHNWQTVSIDNNVHTYFVPFNLTEFKLVIDTLKLHLTDTGAAIIHPRPWVYDMDGFEAVKNVLAGYQIPGYYKKIAGDELTNYIVVTK